MSKTMIVYGTRYGATAEVAQEIAGLFEKQFGLSVQVIDLSRQKITDISGYDNIVIGSGIKMGRWVGKAKKFLKMNFEGKKLAVFVCSGRAGEPDSYAYALENYIKKVLSKYLKVQPVAYEAFGGRKPLKDSTFHDNRDWGKIRSWAKKVGTLFCSSSS
jgi:menaquinone-dependent protoporphyrinogen IX oxidase